MLVQLETCSQVIAASAPRHCIDSLQARLAQSVERKAFNLVVVGSSPTVGVLLYAGHWRRKCNIFNAARFLRFFIKTANSTRARAMPLQLETCHRVFAVS